MQSYLRAHLFPERTPMEDAIRLALGPHRSFRRGKVAIGLAWLHGRRGKRSFVFHNGGTVGFGSFAAFDPERENAVVLLSNSPYLLRSGRTALALLQALGT
jgi:D-alanyl-D-alanine-carboxypeptidase/D-alanyl-D-alanine-endopeptidase